MKKRLHRWLKESMPWIEGGAAVGIVLGTILMLAALGREGFWPGPETSSRFVVDRLRVVFLVLLVLFVVVRAVRRRQARALAQGAPKAEQGRGTRGTGGPRRPPPLRNHPEDGAGHS